ncbi:MAG: hypothetical protein SGI73_09165 [Chloroflexota bacterium]|nr:hypothetical protein [Chloroflexota bacterium]
MPNLSAGMARYAPYDGILSILILFSTRSRQSVHLISLPTNWA